MLNPFLWETSEQRAARWHADGEGPVQYFSDTPDGAWAEFLRHEEITDPKGLEGIQRTISAIEIPDHGIGEYARPRLAAGILLGDQGTYPACQAEARKLRASGASGIIAPSAALLNGLQPGNARNGQVIVLFGQRPDLTGWVAARDGRPEKELVKRIRRF